MVTHSQANTVHESHVSSLMVSLMLEGILCKAPSAQYNRTVATVDVIFGPHV